MSCLCLAKLNSRSTISFAEFNIFNQYIFAIQVPYLYLHRLFLVVVVVVVFSSLFACLIEFFSFFFRRSKRHKKEDRIQEKGTGQKYVHPNGITVKVRMFFKQESVLK